jgi:hypothetical protein
MATGNLKAWQIVVVVAAIVASALSLYYFSTGTPQVKMTDTITLVDVKTGDLFVTTLKGSHAVVVPAKNPDTGSETLIPVDKVDGKWVIGKRHLPGAVQLAGQGNGVLDQTSGEVKVKNDSPRKLP